MTWLPDILQQAIDKSGSYSYILDDSIIGCFDAPLLFPSLETEGDYLMDSDGSIDSVFSTSTYALHNSDSDVVDAAVAILATIEYTIDY